MLLTVVTPRVFAFGTPEKAGFCFVASTHLCTKGISLVIPTFWASLINCWPNARLFFVQNINLRAFLYLFTRNYFYFFFCTVIALWATKLVFLLYKNRAALWTKLHFIFFCKVYLLFYNLTI